MTRGRTVRPCVHHQPASPGEDASRRAGLTLGRPLRPAPRGQGPALRRPSCFVPSVLVPDDAPNVKVWRMSRPIRRVLFRVPVASDAATAIHLGRPLLTGSSALPAHSTGPVSSVRCLGLLRVGFTEPPQSPGALVVSYTTVSPLPARSRRFAFCGTVPRVTPGGCWPPPCPVEPGRSSAGSLLTRPPGRLIRRQS